MKKILFFITALTFCFTCYCQEFPKIDEELQNEIQLRNGDELIKINIIMKNQYDQFELRSKSAMYRSNEAKRSFVVNELKHFSKETQEEVMSYLDYFANNKSVSDITQFWIYNGITCYATKEVIEVLASLDDVLVIGFDKEHNWLFENEIPRAVDDGDSREITYNVIKVNANLVWALGYTGEGVIVAIVDTGVNYNHNDLKTHMWEHPNYPNHGWNFVNNGNNPMDDHSHGTHCAGTVAGNGAAGSQTGMAPDARIMAVKVWNNNGSGSTSQMCLGIQFAVEKGAHVVSMSGGVGGGGSTSERIQFRNTMINVLEAGVIASIAAGNEHSGYSSQPIPNQVRVPGNCPPPWLHPDQTTQGGITSVVCVGATDQNDLIASFSSWGPVTWQNITGFNDYPYNPGMGLIRPDVCAPGVSIKSCTHNNNSGYTLMDGTSMATPCVSGVMALMLSKNLTLTPAKIDEILETTAVHLPTSTSPKGNTFGSGRIDAFEAISAVAECSIIKNLTYTLSYNKTVNLSWSKPVNDAVLMGYNIYRDGVLLAELLQTESFTAQVAEEGDYLFCVSAVHNECESPLACKNIHVVSICDAVTDLVSSVDGFQVNLSWNAPELVAEVSHYNIYRNDIFVTSVQTESFNEEAAAGNYTYSVKAQYFNECTSDEVSINVLVLAAPVNLTATASTQTMSIELLWEYDHESALFNVYKDDVKIASNITDKHYSDSDVAGCIGYCYYVKALVEEIESAASNVDCAGFAGIEEFSNHLKVYPNPSSTVINIEGQQINNISIINTIGQIIKVVPVTDIITSIDVSHLSSGNYVFCISYLDNSTENVKIVIK
ncbi:MAG: S8 family peptidase [Bacteroidetes bacterium]|nr:S8 family peptidase [Bacteroidota bacterium]MCL1969500.1 S8 family peptidase [Bacteroidota bacterium]